MPDWKPICDVIDFWRNEPLLVEHEPNYPKAVEICKEDIEMTFKQQTLGIPFKRDPEFQKAVDVWREYYDSAEELERRFHHLPAPNHGKGVFIKPPSPSANLIRNLRRDVSAKLRSINLSQDDVLHANVCAQREHDAELEPCECTSCTDYRKTGRFPA